MKTIILFPAAIFAATAFGADDDGVKKVQTWTEGQVSNIEASSSHPTMEAFVESVLMIIGTELGDKTFFIAAMLAMRCSHTAVFFGSFSALAAMTLLGVIVGMALPTFLPREYTHWAATLLFIYFGQKLLREGFEMVSAGTGAGPSDELEEVEENLAGKDGDNKLATMTSFQVAIHALTLTFLAEWGDRSQISTIALAASEDPLGVILGGICGHCLCTGLAVSGGRALASRISERSVLLAGGALFMVFAMHAALMGP